jgi:hypothetical protein
LTQPQVPSTVFTERAGVIAVATVANLARCLWRETLMHGVGIDGHIEYVDAGGNATGRSVALQVKSGSSYFPMSGDVIRFNPSEAHRSYWTGYHLPVILVFHRPEDGLLCWADARHQLRINPGTNTVVELSREFDEHGVIEALEQQGALPIGAFDSTQVLERMIAAEMTNGSGVTFFHLFVQGLTDIAHSLYFGMDLVSEVCSHHTDDDTFHIGEKEFDYLDTYVSFLVAWDLARFDFDAVLHLRDSLGLVATFVAR